MQLRVLSQVKVDKVSTSQFNLTTNSNIIKKRNIIIVTYENWFLYSVVKNILVLEHRLNVASFLLKIVCVILISKPNKTVRLKI